MHGIFSDPPYPKDPALQKQSEYCSNAFTGLTRSAEPPQLAQTPERQVRSGCVHLRPSALPLPAHSEPQVRLLLAHDPSQLHGESDPDLPPDHRQYFLLSCVSSHGERESLRVRPYADQSRVAKTAVWRYAFRPGIAIVFAVGQSGVARKPNSFGSRIRREANRLLL